MEKYLDYLVSWLQDCVKKANAKGLIVGVSGGIDSAVVANLIKIAFPNDSIGLILPCFSKQEDVDHALIVVNDAKLNHYIINLDQTYLSLEQSLKDNGIASSMMANANTKARLRMTTLYNVAQTNNYLVVGTDNACEWYTGYFTKYGDGGVDIAPLLHLSKSQVYELARILKVNEQIINKAPSAGLIENQSDEDEMQVSYQELEAYMNGEKVSLFAQERIEFLHRISEHKRSGIKHPDKKVSDL